MSEKKYPLLVARLWWCEDEVCDCTQYIIERVSQNPLDRRFFHRSRLWEGEFVSEGAGWADEGQQERRRQAYRVAAAEFGIELNEDLSGERPE